MANFKEGGLTSGRAYDRNIKKVFSLADRWAFNRRGLYIKKKKKKKVEGLISGSLRYFQQEILS